MDDFYWTSWKYAGSQLFSEVAMTPPRAGIGGNTGKADTFDPTALTRLEGRVDNGEQDIRELRKALDDQKESQDRLERRIDEREDKRQELDRQIYERLGSMKTMQTVSTWIMGAILAAIVGLAFVALKH